MEEELKDNINERSDRLDNIPDEFVQSVSGLQSKISREIQSVVSQLDMEGGQILNTERNFSLIEGLNQRIKDLIFSDEYEKNLTKFISEFNTQAGLSNEYFQILDSGFEVKPIYEQALLSAQKNALSLLSEDAFTQALIIPIKQTLESSITNKVSFSETLTNLRYIIEGDQEIDGRLLSHVKRVAYDSFAASDRSYTNTISVDLGLEFFRYTGGRVQETRCFCGERIGKFFHRKEIENWGDGIGVGSCGYPWQGMNSNTDKATIFIYAGGYNCRHSIAPVSIKSVPSDVIERAKSKGYYKED